MTWPRGLATLAMVVMAAAALVVVLDDDDPEAQPARSAATPKAERVVDAPGCGVNTRGAWTGAPSRRDVRLGPLILRGARQWARWRPDAFDGHGYKIPALLPNGAVATLSVQNAMRGRVGLVYSTAALEQRSGGAGVGAADASVRFSSCPAEPAGRTGWTGGIVLDRPRCVTLIVEVPGRAPVRGRVALGRACHAAAPSRR